MRLRTAVVCPSDSARPARPQKALALPGTPTPCIPLAMCLSSATNEPASCPYHETRACTRMTIEMTEYAALRWTARMARCIQLVMRQVLHPVDDVVAVLVNKG